MSALIGIGFFLVGAVLALFAAPKEVELVYQYLSERWGQSIPQVVEHIYSNFLTLLAQ